MADLAPLFTKRSRLFAKIETTAGDAISVSTSDGAFSAFDVDIQPDIAIDERPQQGSSALLPGIPGDYKGTARFRLNVSGSGATGGVPGWADIFLPACAYKKATGTFTRTEVIADQKTVTLVHCIDGIRKTLAGAMGKFTITGRNGRINDINFEFKGKYWSETAGSLLTATDPTVKPPRGFETFTVGSYQMRAPEFTLDFGQSVQMIESENDTNDTGYLRAYVPSFKPTLNVSPYAELIATKDWYSEFQSATEAALSIVMGATANNIVTIAETKAQLAAGPWGERNEMRTRDLVFNLNNGPTIAFS